MVAQLRRHARIPVGPAPDDPRLAAVLARRGEDARRAARGTSAWERDGRGAAAAGEGRVRLPEALLGAVMTMEVLPFAVGGLAVPLSEMGMVLLFVLALCHRRRRDISALDLLGVAGAAVAVFLAVVSIRAGIPDQDWLRRLLRLCALGGLIACFAARRLDLRSVLIGLLGAMAVNVPLFYAGLVPRPYGDYLTGFLGDKNVAGLYYAAMPVLALTLVRSPRTRLALLAAAGVCVFLTGSRTSLAGLACAVVWIWLTPRLGPVVRLGILGVMAWLVSYAEENLARIGIYAERDGTDRLRATIQEATAGKVAGTPWHGRGLTEAHVTIGPSTWHYHDSYAALFTEGGYVLLVFVLGLYAVLGLRILTARLRTPSRVAVEAATVVVFVTATQLGEVFLTIPGMLILAVGTGLFLEERDAPLDAEARARRQERVLAQARARAGV